MEVLLTIFLIIVAFGYLLRLLMPFLLKRWAKRISKKFGEQQSGGFYQKQNTRRQRPEGEVTIEQTESTEKVIDKSVGDYVDFEEEKL